MTQHDTEPMEFDSPAEACAYLAAVKIDSYGVVTHAEANGELVRVWIAESGVNLSNVGRAIDMDVAEIGPIEAYNEDTRANASDDTTTYANLIVHGLRPAETDGWGYGLPTQVPTRSGAECKPRAELEPDIRRAAEVAGVFEAIETDES